MPKSKMYPTHFGKLEFKCKWTSLAFENILLLLNFQF